MRVSLVCFLLLHGVEAQHNHVQDTTKKRTVFKKNVYKEKKVQFRRRCILPSTFCGGQGVQELAKSDDVLILTGCGTFDLSLTPSFFSLSLTLSLSHSYLSHSQPVSPLFLPVHFVIPNRTLPKE